MSDPNENPSSNPRVTPPAAAAPKLDPVTVMFALASYGRWPMVQFLADGRTASVSEIAAAVGLDRDVTAKQLKVLRRCGVLESRNGDDRRQTVYSIPAAYLPAPKVLDFGFCVLKLDKV